VHFTTLRTHFYKFKISWRLYVFGECQNNKVVNISNRILRLTLIGRSELESWLFIWAMVVQDRSGCAFLSIRERNQSERADLVRSSFDKSAYTRYSTRQVLS
jgi:hypothetical protein